MSASEVVPSKYDLELSDVNYIVERYQQRAFQLDPAAGTFAGYQNVIVSSRQMLDMAVNTLLIFNETEPRTPVSGEIQTLSGGVPCSNVEFSEELEDDVDLKVNLNPLWKEHAAASEALEERSSQDDIENCFCTEVEGFGGDWDFKPVFMLDGLRDMIDNINNSIDQLMQQLDPYNLLNGLCPFLGDFNKSACMIDLKALSALIALLMKRYSMASMDLVLNWSLLLGPIIKGAVDAMATLIEEILQWVSHIFVCFKSYLEYARKMIADSQALIAEAGNLVNRVTADSFGETFKGENYRPSTFQLGPNYSGGSGTAEGSKQAAMDTFGDWKGKGRSSSWNSPPSAREYFDGQGTPPKSGSYNFNMPSFAPPQERKMFSKGGGVPTSFNLKYKPTMENMFGLNQPLEKDDNWLQKGTQGLSNAIGGVNTQLVDRILAMVNSAENYIKELFGSLMVSIKSLNNMISQNFDTSIKLGGAILALIDLLNIIEAVSKMKAGENLCDDIEAGDFETFENFLKSLYGVDELDLTVSEDGTAYIDSGIYDLNVLKYCNNPDVDPGYVGTLHVSEEERNNTTEAPYNDWSWKW